MDGNLVTIFKDTYSIFDIVDTDFDKWLETEDILFSVFDKEVDSNKQILYNIYSGYRNYKRYIVEWSDGKTELFSSLWYSEKKVREIVECQLTNSCLLYTSDAADDP
mgnify:CR=1 FL=1